MDRYDQRTSQSVKYLKNLLEMQMIKLYILLQVGKTLFLLYVVTIVPLVCMLIIYHCEWQDNIDNQQTGCNSLERNKSRTV